MPHYRYRATDATGTVVKATADSRSENELRDALLLQNLDVTHIKEQRRLGDIELGQKRVPPMEIMQFSKQMATFVRAGISIPEGLDVIIESTSSKTLPGNCCATSVKRSFAASPSPTHSPNTSACFRRTSSASAGPASSPAESTPCSSNSATTSSATSRRDRR